jgi:hypothetical protein
VRIGFLLLWLAVPVAAGFYHLGPGQEDLKNDVANIHLTKAANFAEQGQWGVAQTNYAKALEALPADQHQERLRIRLELAKAQLNDAKLAPAYNELSLLVEELEGAEQPNRQLINETKASLAHAEYYLTWLLRLEGEPKEIWELEIESARQTFRMLAEEAEAAGDSVAAKRYSKDLESAIRLARMDLSELEALALPSQCKGCKSGQCNCKGKKPGKKPGNGKKPPKDARGASMGPPPEGGGS